MNILPPLIRSHHFLSPAINHISANLAASVVTLILKQHAIAASIVHSKLAWLITIISYSPLVFLPSPFLFFVFIITSVPSSPSSVPALYRSPSTSPHAWVTQIRQYATLHTTGRIIHFNVIYTRTCKFICIACHGRFVGPTFSIVVHPVFYHFTTLLAFVAPTSPRLSQLRSRAPGCLGPPKDCKLQSRSCDVFLRESSEL